MAGFREHIDQRIQREKMVIASVVLICEALGILTTTHAVMNMRTPQE